MRTLLLLFLGLLLISSCEKKSEHYHKQISICTEITDSLIAANHIPGLALTIHSKGKTVFSKGFGYANLEQGIKADPATTRFRVGSISKPITADALVQLAAQNKLQLDSPIQFYLPEFPKKKGRITPRLAAGHLAGIRHYKGSEFHSSKHFNNIKDALEIFKNDTLISFPREEYHYSSYGWNLLSRVVEASSGEEFLSYMQKNVFTPLNMTQTIADHTDSIIANRSGFYTLSGNDEVINGTYVDNSIKWAGGGFLSTSEDIMRFAEAHLKEGFLSKKQLSDLVAPQKTASGENTEYGLGWASGKDKLGKFYYGHAGGSVGGSCHMIIYPNEEVIVVVLTNRTGVNFGSYSHDIANIFMKK